MRILVGFLGIAAGCWGATVTLDVRCSDAVTTVGATSAECAGATTNAQAALNLSGLYPGIEAHAFGGTPGASARISYSENFILTMSGLGGPAIVRPCFNVESAVGFSNGYLGFYEGSVYIAGISGPDPTTQFISCASSGITGIASGGFLVDPTLPMMVTLRLSVGVSAFTTFDNSVDSLERIAFAGFRVEDRSGPVLPGATATFTVVPEPNAISMMGGGALLIYCGYLRRSRNPA